MHVARRGSLVKISLFPSVRNCWNCACIITARTKNCMKSDRSVPEKVSANGDVNDWK